MHEQDMMPIWGAQGSLAADVPWLQLVRAVLGPDARPSFCGVVFSRPRSPAQQWHIDSPQEAAEHRAAHAVNVLVAMAAGECVIFDDRILPCGLANASQQERWVAYFSYLRPRPGLEDIADTHFEATRSLFGDGTP